MCGLGPGANSWLKALTGTGPVGIAFGLAFQMIALLGMKFVHLPYIDLKFIMTDDKEDDINLTECISFLKAEVLECLIRLNTAPQTTPQTPGSLIPSHINFD